MADPIVDVAVRVYADLCQQRVVRSRTPSLDTSNENGCHMHYHSE